MRKTTVQFTCDVCKSEPDREKITTIENLHVIFTTETIEGRNVPPYLETQDLDLCRDCYMKILRGSMIFAEGAMGFNRYYFS